MDTVHSIQPVLVLATSLAAAILIMVTGDRNRNLREAWTLVAALLKFLIVLSMVPAVLDRTILECTLVSIAPGLTLQFRVDSLGLFFALAASFLWLVTSFYSIGYVRSQQEHAQTRYFACFAGAMSATMGVAFAGNLFTTFLFYEIITICTFPLVAHKETADAMAGGRRYLTYLLGTSVAFQLTAIVLTYSFAGTLEYADAGILAGRAPDSVLMVIFVLFIAGISKAAMMPFHSWLPAAMVAPTPVSALLHAVAVVKTGVFVVLRVVLHVFGVDLLGDLGLGTALVYFASFTIITASVIALRQDNLKRRLAYSTVSQLSYVILGAALLTPSSITGGIMHIALHAFGKITLFFAAGAIYVAAHKTEISQLNGIGKQMPFTMAAFTLGSLSMIGMPPLGGFLSKWWIALGAIEAKELLILIVIATSTILNAAYFLPILYAVFFKEPRLGQHGSAGEGIHEAPLLMVVPLMLTALGALALFFAPSVFLDLARGAVSAVMGGQ
ncbi:MAG: monovalent cation/H+ antiporter subunit D family protein [Nitrospirota bacterium]|nr:monovalent cation/H+ antiporter subunit D family protein [Nitrospirota bacterium]